MAQREQGFDADGRDKEVMVSHGFATDYDEDHHVAARRRRGPDTSSDHEHRALLAAIAGLGIAALAGAAIAARRRRDSRPTDAYGNLDIDETDRLISSSKVENTAVYNPSGERLGEVKNFMVDKFSGQVRYAVLSFGSMLGLGERHYPLPWDALNYDEGMGGYVVDLDREDLESAPSYEVAAEPAFDTTYRRRILLFYR